MRQLATHQYLNQIRQQLNRIESQIRNQQMYTDITIDNKTDRELQLTINLDDQNIGIKSKIDLPHNSSITHKINQEKDEEKGIHKDQSLPLHRQFREQQFIYPYQRNHVLSVSRQYQQLSSTRLEQKFQPIPTHKTNIHQSQYRQSHHQIQQQRRMSQSKQEDKIDEVSHIYQDENLPKEQEQEDLVQSKYLHITNRKINQILIQDTQTSKILEQTVAPIPLPYSIQDQNTVQIAHHFQTQKKQEYEKPSSQAKISQLNWSLHSLERSSLKQPREELNTHWKVDRISPQPKRILNFQPKTYKERSNKKKSVNSGYMQQREKRTKERLNTENITKASKSRNKENITKQKKIQKVADSTIADDLFLKRKKECLNKLNKQRKLINSIRKPEKDRSVSSNNFKQINKRQRSPSNNPLVEQITTRLHSSKLSNPCSRFQRFSESIQKQRFNQLVNDNTFVCRYLSNTEREELFQRLRKSKDSVNVWPVKIMNQAYSKLKRITHPTNA